MKGALFWRGMRHARWVLVVAWAAVGGAAVRLARRLSGAPPRIVHGMSPMVVTPYMVQADRMAGFPSHSVAWYRRPSGYALVRDQDFDVVIGVDGKPSPNDRWKCLVHVLRNADIWVSFFDGVFFRNGDESANTLALRLVKAAGIRLIVHPHGMDIVHRTRLRTRYDWVGLLQADYPAWDMEQDDNSSRSRIRLFCRYADLVVGGGWYMTPMLPRSELIFHTSPIDCDVLVPSPLAHPRKRPVVIHSPNHRHVKGTVHLVRAVEQLRAAGIDCELRLIEKVPRQEALEQYRDADVIADQFCIGTIGIFGFEALALGKPVMAYIDQAHLADPVFNHPIVNTNPENLPRVLAALLLVPVLRERLGRAGRASVEQYQSVPAMAQVWAQIYRHVWRGTPLALTQTAHFSSLRPARPFTEDPAQPGFWHVPVDDLMPGIRAALARLEPHPTIA